MKKLLTALLFTFAFCAQATAATCFWVGGTGNWDSVNVVSWSSGTGGAGSTCAATGGIPKNAGDIATFDAASGGGTVTVCGALSSTCPTSSGTVSLATITTGAFTGTLDFSAINPNVNLTTALILSGTGTRTINLGSGTISLSAVSGTILDITTTTNLTLTGGVVDLTATTTRQTTTAVVGTPVTLGSLTIRGNSNASITMSGAGTITTMTLVAPVYLLVGSTSPTYTNFVQSGSPSITALTTVLGSSFGNLGAGRNLNVSSGTPSLSYAVIGNVTCTGGATFAFTNSLDMGSNTTCNISPPTIGAGGGGGFIIGGG